MYFPWVPRNRPSPRTEAYVPTFARGDGPAEPVPEKLAGLRLSRRRMAKMTPTPLVIRLAIVATALGFLWGVVQVFTRGAGG